MAQTFNKIFKNKLLLRSLVRGAEHRMDKRVFSTTDILKSGFQSRRDTFGGLRDLKRRVEYMKRKGTYHNFKRSQFQEWNLDAELYAFGKRLDESFDDNIIREAFTDQSYVHEEKKRLEEVGMSDSIQVSSNRALADVGKSLIEDFSKKYFRSVWPLVPEEGIEKIAEYLTSNEVLIKIGTNLGLKDLILCEGNPPTEDMHAICFLAVVGALNASSGVERSQKFIIDFVLTQMIGKSIWDVWEIIDPMTVLQRITESKFGGPPEPRILGQIGQNTLESVYHIGIYVNKELLECGYGETIQDGVNSAILNSLSTLFGQGLDADPVPFARELQGLSLKSTPSKSLIEWDGK